MPDSSLRTTTPALRAAVGEFLARVPRFAGHGHTPFVIAGRPRGWVNATIATALRSSPATFDCHADHVRLRDEGLSAAQRSERLQAVAAALRDAGLIPGWRGELYSLRDETHCELLRLERAAFRTFGLQSRAVHINGFTRDGRLWIGRRSLRKPTDPGKLDNFAAGGITAGEKPGDCAIRELWEEAGVPEGLAATAHPAGPEIRSLRVVTRGVHDEILLCYDIELPRDFRPRCHDGEVAEFLLLAPEDVATRLTAGEFTWDAGLVTADWLQRRGLA